MFGTFRCPEQAVAVRAGAREEVTPASGRRDISFRKPRLFRDELIQFSASNGSTGVHRNHHIHLSTAETGQNGVTLAT